MKKYAGILAVMALALPGLVAGPEAALAGKSGEECKAAVGRCKHDCPQFVSGYKDERWKRCVGKCQKTFADCMKQAHKDREPSETPPTDSTGSEPPASDPSSTPAAQPRDCPAGYKVLDKPNKYGAYCEIIPVPTATCVPPQILRGDGTCGCASVEVTGANCDEQVVK